MCVFLKYELRVLFETEHVGPLGGGAVTTSTVKRHPIKSEAKSPTDQHFYNTV